MRILHYLELENFKRYGEKQRIELDHPAVLIGPNNCGKTSAIQALALWSQALCTWYDAKKSSSAKERTAASLNRLNIVAVPVTRTRFFWHNNKVRSANTDIPLIITVGVEFKGQVEAISMRFRNQGDELVYCVPDDAVKGNIDLLAYAASLKVELLYPMSGLDTEEPILQPGRVDVLLGQGRTADVLRNLCLSVAKSNPSDWQKITGLMKRLFSIDLGTPEETTRGSIVLTYKQKNVKEELDISSSGRGMLQMLLIFSYLYSHKGGVLLVDEPDAHLEILRQKQVYILLREIAHENNSQVVMVTHSEVILEEALENNLTLLLEGKTEDLAKKEDIRNSLRYFGADHYIKARERGYVLYIEGSTDVDMLRALAEHLRHPVAEIWDERINTFYVQNNHPLQDRDSDLDRVEGGFGQSPRKHFTSLRNLIPNLQGLAILDNDGQNRHSREGPASDPLTILYWKRYEAENYFITPQLLRSYAREKFPIDDLFSQQTQQSIDRVLDKTVTEFIFDGDENSYKVWQNSPFESAQLILDTKSERKKMSKMAEIFFENLSREISCKLLMKKGEFHQLIKISKLSHSAEVEIREKLDSIHRVFLLAKKHHE